MEVVKNFLFKFGCIEHIYLLVVPNISMFERELADSWLRIVDFLCELLAVGVN